MKIPCVKTMKACDTRLLVVRNQRDQIETTESYNQITMGNRRPRVYTRISPSHLLLLFQTNDPRVISSKKKRYVRNNDAQLEKT